MKRFLESKTLLETVVSEAEKSNEEAKRLVDHLSDAQMNWKAAPDSWSIAQCLDHLAVSSAGFNELFPAAIERGRAKWPTSSEVQYRPSLIGGWLARQLLPETTRKFKAPKIFRPGESSAIHGALEKFLNQQQRFLKFVTDSHGVDYNRVRLRSPVTPLLRYSLADAFVITVVHTWRHLAQARRVREAPAFPAAE
jgi:hypothetical protein